MLVQALLGMRPMAPFGLLIIDPQLPVWLPDLKLEGLRVADTLLDIAFWRQADGKTSYRVTNRTGNIRVLHQPPSNGPGSNLTRRDRNLLSSLLHLV